MCPLREIGYSQLTSTLASPLAAVECRLLLWEQNWTEMSSSSIYQHFSQRGAYATFSWAFMIPGENHESEPKRMLVGDEAGDSLL